MKCPSLVATLSVFSCWLFWTEVVSGKQNGRKYGQKRRSPAEMSSVGGGNDCHRDETLLVYKVRLSGRWSRDNFPKHFPDWRPKAHFSKVIGRSHNDKFKLFRMDERVTEGVRVFAETGTSDVLNDISQGAGAIFDEFNAPPILGVGETEAEFFVDGNHSKVSLMARLVPSPDWFVGLDNIDLCNDGTWVSSLTIEGHPLDAGTDNGLTFTSPNWRSEPYSVVSRLTTKNPNHPASSFYYADRDQHPPIAMFQFDKVKEYELSQVYNLQSLKYDTGPTESMSNSRVSIRQLESTAPNPTKVKTVIQQSQKPQLSTDFMTYLTQNEGQQNNDTAATKKKHKRFRGPRNSHPRRHHRPLFNWTES